MLRVVLVFLACSGVAGTGSTGYAYDDVSNVRRQYEIFPYPDLGPAPSSLDKADFVKTEAPRLLMANHFLHNGQLFKLLGHSASRPLNVLIAGGGTGRDTVLMAKEMEDSGLMGSITHLDLSQAAIAIAQEWTNVAGLLHRVYFERNSIENFTAQYEIDGLPLFDFIWCSGVLHHLDDPLVGLNGLRRIMAPEGGMFVMVYGLHGRAGVYDMQAALRYALPPNEQLSDRERINELKDFLSDEKELRKAVSGDGASKSDDKKAHRIAGLPDTSTFALNKEMAAVVDMGDAALFDMLLHSQDRAYSILDFHAFVSSAGLQVVALIPEASYWPEATVFQTEELRQSHMARRIRNRSRLEQFHFSELVTSRPIYHSAFVTHSEKSTADSTSSELTGLPWICEDRSWMHEKTPVVINAPELMMPQGVIPKLKKMAVLRKDPDIKFEFSRRQGSAMAKFQLPVLSFGFLQASMNGSKTAAKIVGEVHSAACAWAREFNLSSQTPLEPLSYAEVEDQFCDWVHKMQAAVKVLWVHV